MSTKFGYKLFEMNNKGELFPLFIDRNTVQPMNTWIHAEYHPTKGFSPRGGWHIGADVPDAPWLKSYDGTETGFYKSRWKTGKRVWCRVEYNANHNYDKEVGELKEKCFKDKVPDDGYYFFREFGKGTWVITSDIKIVEIITEEERQRIMEEKHYDEVATFKKYNEVFEKKLANRKTKYNDWVGTADSITGENN